MRDFFHGVVARGEDVFQGASCGDDGDARRGRVEADGGDRAQLA